jgi:hypothetical protein
MLAAGSLSAGALRRAPSSESYTSIWSGSTAPGRAPDAAQRPTESWERAPGPRPRKLYGRLAAPSCDRYAARYGIVRRLFLEPGGLPGPRRRRRRRRPFFAGFFGVRLPKRLATALRTSVCTSSRMTVMMLFCRGIPPPCCRRLAYPRRHRFANAAGELPRALVSLHPSSVDVPTLRLSGEKVRAAVGDSFEDDEET